MQNTRLYSVDRERKRQHDLMLVLFTGKKIEDFWRPSKRLLGGMNYKAMTKITFHHRLSRQSDKNTRQTRDFILIRLKQHPLLLRAFVREGTFFLGGGGGGGLGNFGIFSKRKCWPSLKF